MKLNEKIRATNLRKKGLSYGEINKRVRVSKSTLSLWLRDIKLTSRQVKRIYIDRRQKNAYNLAKFNRKRKIERTKEVIKTAKKEANKLFKDPLFSPGLMLYWAEGSNDLQEKVKLSNSDSAMILFMMKWFRKFCNVPEKKFRIALHIHTLHCRKNVEKYWSKITNIPLSQFQKTQIKPTSLGQRKNPLYNGTCNIIVSDKDLFRRIKGWKLRFLEKVITRPRSSTG